MEGFKGRRKGSNIEEISHEEHESIHGGSLGDGAREETTGASNAKDRATREQ